MQNIIPCLIAPSKADKLRHAGSALPMSTRRESPDFLVTIPTTQSPFLGMYLFLRVSIHNKGIMGIIFGKKKPPSRVTAQDKAVLQLKQQRDKLKQYQKRIELTLASDRDLAKRLLSKGQKDRALLLLKKKRYQEQLLRKTDGQLENLEKLTHDIEFAQIELQVVDGLKQGNEALKKMNDALNIEDIERILDETREAKEKQDEISSLLSGGLTDEDEEAVEDELAAILKEQMPNVPSGDVHIEDEEEAIAQNEESKKQSPTKHKAKKPKALDVAALEA